MYKNPKRKKTYRPGCGANGHIKGDRCRICDSPVATYKKSGI